MSERINIAGTSPFEPIIGLSRAVRIGNQVHVSGTGPVGAEACNAAEQADQCLTLIAKALKQAGSSIEHVYRTRVYLTKAADWEMVARIHSKFFSIIRPAATVVVVSGFVDPAWLVEVEVDAAIPDAG